MINSLVREEERVISTFLGYFLIRYSPSRSLMLALPLYNIKKIHKDINLKLCVVCEREKAFDIHPEFNISIFCANSAKFCLTRSNFLGIFLLRVRATVKGSLKVDSDSLKERKKCYEKNRIKESYVNYFMNNAKNETHY
jgi:hypothetical protein